MSGFGSKSEMSSNKRSPYFYDPLRSFTGRDFPSGIFPTRNCFVCSNTLCVFTWGVTNITLDGIMYHVSPAFEQ